MMAAAQTRRWLLSSSALLPAALAIPDATACPAISKGLQRSGLPTAKVGAAVAITAELIGLETVAAFGATVALVGVGAVVLGLAICAVADYVAVNDLFSEP